ncbi:nucleoside-diphosphate kinase [[Eubacterium] cellulosolvens]
MEKTLLLIKPEGVMRGLIGEVIARLEKKGLNIAAIKLLKMSKSQSEALYSMHKTKDFFPKLIDHMTSSPIIAMVIEGPNVVNIARAMIGATDPKDAAPGTIRAEFALNKTQNIVHASDSSENATRETSIFFRQEEIISYEKPTEIEFLGGKRVEK